MANNNSKNGKSTIGFKRFVSPSNESNNSFRGCNPNGVRNPHEFNFIADRKCKFDLDDERDGENRVVKIVFSPGDDLEMTTSNDNTIVTTAVKLGGRNLNGEFDMEAKKQEEEAAKKQEEEAAKKQEEEEEEAAKKREEEKKIAAKKQEEEKKIAAKKQEEEKKHEEEEEEAAKKQEEQEEEAAKKQEEEEEKKIQDIQALCYTMRAMVNNAAAKTEASYKRMQDMLDYATAAREANKKEEEKTLAAALSTIADMQEEEKKIAAKKQEEEKKKANEQEEEKKIAAKKQEEEEKKANEQEEEKKIAAKKQEEEEKKADEDEKTAADKIMDLNLETLRDEMFEHIKGNQELHNKRSTLYYCARLIWNKLKDGLANKCACDKQALADATDKYKVDDIEFRTIMIVLKKMDFVEEVDDVKPYEGNFTTFLTMQKQKQRKKLTEYLQFTQKVSNDEERDMKRRKRSQNRARDNYNHNMDQTQICDEDCLLKYPIPTVGIDGINDAKTVCINDAIWTEELENSNTSSYQCPEDNKRSPTFVIKRMYNKIQESGGHIVGESIDLWMRRITEGHEEDVFVTNASFGDFMDHSDRDGNRHYITNNIGNFEKPVVLIPIGGTRSTGHWSLLILLNVFTKSPNPEQQKKKNTRSGKDETKHRNPTIIHIDSTKEAAGDNEMHQFRFVFRFVECIRQCIGKRMSLYEVNWIVPGYLPTQSKTDCGVFTCKHAHSVIKNRSELSKCENVEEILKDSKDFNFANAKDRDAIDSEIRRIRTSFAITINSMSRMDKREYEFDIKSIQIEDDEKEFMKAEIMKMYASGKRDKAMRKWTIFKDELGSEFWDELDSDDGVPEGDGDLNSDDGVDNGGRKKKKFWEPCAAESDEEEKKQDIRRKNVSLRRNPVPKKGNGITLTKVNGTNIVHCGEDYDSDRSDTLNICYTAPQQRKFTGEKLKTCGCCRIAKTRCEGLEKSTDGGMICKRCRRTRGEGAKQCVFMRELRKGRNNKPESSGNDGREETKKSAVNSKSTNEKAKPKVYIEEKKEEDTKKRKSSDQNESDGNKRRKYEPVTQQRVNTPETRFSAEQRMKLQLSKDRTKRSRETTKRSRETTKRRRYAINKLVETGKILLHNITSIEPSADTSTCGGGDNKSPESDNDSKSSESDDDNDSSESDSDKESSESDNDKKSSESDDDNESSESDSDNESSESDEEYEESDY